MPCGLLHSEESDQDIAHSAYEVPGSVDRHPQFKTHDITWDSCPCLEARVASIANLAALQLISRVNRVKDSG